ncbi:MAG: hypothetical protein LBV04_01265, partial [Deferribacteraceae bacterium]|nr:hypothetical protein [Deferribacteraceae bacterium]
AEIYSKAITDAGAQISSKLDNMAAQAADKEALLYENLNKIADQREKAAIARRETMTTLANMTGDLANSATVVRDLKLVLQSLALATGAMRIVKVYLSDIALFWKNVEKFCDRLLEGVVKIEVEVKLNEDIEDYIPFFEDSFFVEGYITNVANWVALNMISVEYLNAFNNTRNEYKQLELSSGEGEPQMHWKRAQDNAKLLQEQITAINLV